jgi:hypothetical protein
MLDSRVSAVILSRGSTWEPLPQHPPYLLADRVPWPDGATAQAVFYDTSGTTLATVDGTVSSAMISFSAAPTVVDLIPNAANFEIFLTVDAKPYQIRYGKVLRREAQFTTQPESVTSPLEFTDSWPTLGIRSTWTRVAGTIAVKDNSGLSLPNGVNANAGSSAMRWYKPLGGDSAKVTVSTVNGFAYGASTTAKMRVILSADVAFSSYLAVEFEASANGGGTHSDLIHLCTGTSSTTVAYQGSPISNVTATGDSYTVRYNDSTGVLSVYKGTDTSPLGSWTDSTHLVPHGPGYRYLGLGWVTSALVSPMLATSWQAIDDI